MIIQNNLLAMNANRQVGVSLQNQNKSIRKLSSGYRINIAADDAAGLSISEKLRSRIHGLERSSQNMQDGISLIQTAEGAIGEIQNIVHRIRELSVKASNDTYGEEDRASVQEEINGLVGEVTRISEETEFNRIKLLNGDLKDTTAAKSTQQVLTLEQAMKSVGEDKVGLIFTEETEFTTIQTPVGSATSNAFGTAIKDTLQQEIVPQAVQSILNTYSDSLSYLTGSSIGIGLELYSQSSSTLASVTVSGTTGTNPYLSFKLSVNVNSLAFNGDGTLTEGSREELEATIAHEMVHALMDESMTAGMLGYNGEEMVTKYPSWFKEGMAQTASGASDWVQYGLGITSAASNSTIKTAFGNLANGSNESNYAAGYLASMYLGYMAAGSAGFDAATISNGIDTIWQSLVSGKSLDQTIADYTKYSGLSDFTTNLQNDIQAYDFVRDLMSAIGSGRGSVISGSLTDTDLLSNTAITGLTLFQLNTSNDTVKNVYPSGVYVFSGGSALEAGFKPNASVPDAPAATDPGGSGTGGTAATLGGLNLQIGADAGQSMKIYIDNMSALSLGLSDIRTDSHSNAQNSITVCDNAITKVSAMRSRLGAYQNRLEHAILNSDNMAENLQAAESRIRDLDMADEMVQYSKSNILLQVGQSMLAQANQQPSNILSLLQ